MKCSNYGCNTLVWCQVCNPDNARNTPAIAAKDAEIARLQAENARLRETQRWVPVGDALPEDNVRVLLWADGEAEMGCCCAETWWWSDGPAGADSGRVTHWRELGAPETKP